MVSRRILVLNWIIVLIVAAVAIREIMYSHRHPAVQVVYIVR